MSVTDLIEDNALGHQTIQLVNKDVRAKQGIITFNWPYQSPNLNQIKPIWSYQNNEISTDQFIGVSDVTVERAKATLVKLRE